jgi:hypothetical protein
MGTTHYGDFFAEKRKKQVATITDNYFLVMDCSLSDKIYNKKKMFSRFRSYFICFLRSRVLLKRRSLEVSILPQQISFLCF